MLKSFSPYENISVFSKEFKVFGIFPMKRRNYFQNKYFRREFSNLKASLEIQSSDLLDNEQTSFDFFKVDALQKMKISNFGGY